MKIIIASDIHGSYETIQILDHIFKTEKADKLILLGDIYNHGPRNPIPDQYDPQNVSKYLNSIVEKLIVIKGNCDSEVDQMISDFYFTDSVYIPLGNTTVFLTHGHVYNKDNVPRNCNALIYGHFHTAFIEKKNDIIIANPGSITLPKDNKRCYLLFDDDMLYLKDILGDLIDSIRLPN